jgi:hypothetical protein
MPRHREMPSSCEQVEDILQPSLTDKLFGLAIVEGDPEAGSSTRMKHLVLADIVAVSALQAMKDRCR